MHHAIYSHSCNSVEFSGIAEWLCLLQLISRRPKIAHRVAAIADAQHSNSHQEITHVE
ncbi:MAG: hypothetical protein AB8B79_08100 [Granulosicoccus sp.]